MTEIALIGGSCEADGHPSECGAVVSGTLTGSTDVSLNGTDIATHADSMDFSSHPHSYSPEPGCGSFNSHFLTPDQTHDVEVNGKSVILKGDSTSDPGAGTASVTSGDSSVTIQ